jgi:glycosyltransferase involved in cell wall biosynthesis
MRVLLMTWACDRDDVSEPEISYKWAREMSQEHDVTVFAVSKPDRYGAVQEQFPHLPVIEWSDIRLPARLSRFQAIVKPGYLPYYIRARRHLRRLLAEQHFDIIHHVSPLAWRYPSPAAGLGVPLLRGPLEGGLPTPPVLAGAVAETEAGFMSLRKTDSMRKRWDPVLRASYRATEKVLGTAPYVRELLAPMPINDFAVELDNGIDDPLPLTYDAMRPARTGRLELLFVGRVIRTKGVRDAVRALARVESRTPVRLTVIGDGEDLEACRREAGELCLGDRVRFLGWRPKADVQAHLAAADVFLFPSFREPTGGVLLEALRHALPCITCDYGGPAQIVDESCGIRIAPAAEHRFAGALAAAIDLLADNADLRGRLAQGAARRVAEDLDWRVKGRRVSGIYEEMAAAARVQTRPVLTPALAGA